MFSKEKHYPIVHGDVERHGMPFDTTSKLPATIIPAKQFSVVPVSFGKAATAFIKAACAVTVFSLCIFGLLFGQTTDCADDHQANRGTVGRTLTKYASATTTPLLQVFQVYSPVLTTEPDGVLVITDGSTNTSVATISNHAATCQETLVVYSFAYSYGEPFVGTYAPPACNFDRVTWNLTVVSAGRQFDRLGIVYLGDIEVFRTSTAEPTSTGIEWTYLKDMTSYLCLFKEPQKIIFDLGNLIDSTYTAAFNVTLTASFFSAPDSISPANLILPISTRQSASNAASVFTVPSNTASNLLTLPQNVLRAVFTVAATGQSDEEFWWSNVLQSAVNTFPSYGDLYGYSPFREVQLYIDGQLAGVAWPFPIIFTGGVVPGLWRPIVGIDAFDLKEDEIDITPFLPLLCDGQSHNFTIRVSGLNDDGNGNAVLSETTDSYWLVTGKVFIWLDSANHTTTGFIESQNVPAPSFQVSSTVGTSNGTNETLVYQVNAQRQLSFTSTLKTSKGSETVSWKQSLSFTNLGNYTDQANVEVNIQNTQGYDVSSSGYSRHYNYPLYAFSSYTTEGDNYTIQATVDRGKNVQTVGQPVFPTGLESFSVAQGVQSQYPSFQGASVATSQNGTATYIANATALTSFSFGTTEQDMVFAGISVGGTKNAEGFPAITGSTELFHRYVVAVNSTVVEDEETLVETSIPHTHINLGSVKGYAVPGINSMLGRGPEGKGDGR